MLEKSVEWRDSFGLQALADGEWRDVIANENSTGKMYVRGYDKEGHPLLYMKPRFENTNDHDGNIKHLVYQMERTIACMKNGQTKLSLLIDYEGFSIFTAPPMKTSQGEENVDVLYDTTNFITIETN